MYAIVQQGGHQYRVGPGDRLLVDRLPADPGTVVALEPVLFLTGEDGTPGPAGSADGARVAATVVGHRRGKKIRVYKYKAKKRYRRTMGHRSDLTELYVEGVLKSGQELPKPTATEARTSSTGTPSSPAGSKTGTKAAAKSADAKKSATPKAEAKPAAAPKASKPDKAPELTAASADAENDAPDRDSSASTEEE
jgi:large subunit ribosomal protein L21